MKRAQRKVQVIFDGVKGAGGSTDAFPYVDEVSILLGSLTINVKHTSRNTCTLTVNCGIRGWDTQEGLKQIFLEGYKSHLRDFPFDDPLVINKKTKNKVDEVFDPEDEYLGYKNSVCGPRRGVARAIPRAMALVRSGEIPLFPKFLVYAKEQGMLWGFEEVYNRFYDWHEENGRKRANYYAAWRNWVLNQREFKPQYFNPNPELERKMEMERQRKEFEEMERMLRERSECR